MNQRQNDFIQFFDIQERFKEKADAIHLVLVFQLLQRFDESILRVIGSGKDKEKRAFQQLEWFGPKKKTRGKDAKYHEMLYFLSKFRNGYLILGVNVN